MNDLMKTLKASYQTIRKHFRALCGSIDFVLGSVTFVAATMGAYSHPSLVSEAGTNLAVASIGLGAAIAAVALTALTLLASLMTDAFAVAIERARGGVEGAIFPFQAVAAIAVGGLVGGLLAIVFGPMLPTWMLRVGFGALCGVNVWMIVGTMQIINIAASLSRSRARLSSGIAEASRKLEDRRAI